MAVHCRCIWYRMVQSSRLWTACKGNWKGKSQKADIKPNSGELSSFQDPFSHRYGTSQAFPSHRFFQSMMLWLGAMESSWIRAFPPSLGSSCFVSYQGTHRVSPSWVGTSGCCVRKRTRRNHPLVPRQGKEDLPRNRFINLPTWTGSFVINKDPQAVAGKGLCHRRSIDMSIAV